VARSRWFRALRTALPECLPPAPHPHDRATALAAALPTMRFVPACEVLPRSAQSSKSRQAPVSSVTGGQRGNQMAGWDAHALTRASCSRRSEPHDPDGERGEGRGLRAFVLERPIGLDGKDFERRRTGGIAHDDELLRGIDGKAQRAG